MSTFGARARARTHRHTVVSELQISPSINFVCPSLVNVLIIVRSHVTLPLNLRGTLLPDMFKHERLKGFCTKLGKTSF